MTGITDLLRYLGMEALGILSVHALMTFRTLGLQSETMWRLCVTRNGVDSIMTGDATYPVFA